MQFVVVQLVLMINPTGKMTLNPRRRKIMILVRVLIVFNISVITLIFHGS